MPAELVLCLHAPWQHVYPAVITSVFSLGLAEPENDL